MNKKQFEERLGDKYFGEWVTTEVSVCSKIKDRIRINYLMLDMESVDPTDYVDVFVKNGKFLKENTRRTYLKKPIQDYIISTLIKISGTCSGTANYIIKDILEQLGEKKEGTKNMNMEEIENKLEQINNKLSNLNGGVDSLDNKLYDIRDNTNKSKLEEALIEGIIEKGKQLATEDLEKEIKERLDDFIKETYGVLPKKIEINNNGNVTTTTINGLTHYKFEEILKIVDKKIPLMLTGPAGAGKNYTLEQIAKALNLDFYFTNAVTQEYKLTGFIDANGIYHETEFYKAFKNGGIFFLDEMDASCPESLVILNSAIANGYFDFPNGRINANENFRVVSASNTYGTGADMVYVGRNVLDGATLDRFVVMPFEYDERVESNLAYDNELFDFIKSLRKAISDNSLRYIVSMRATINATKMLEIGIDKSEILKNAIVKNMQVDDLNIISKKICCNNCWTDELQKLAN